MTRLLPRTHEDGPSHLVAYDHGATLARWDLDGRPVLWLSDRAVLDGSAAVRGGIPLCLPWFANGPDGDLSPNHGLARTATWHPAETSGEQVWAWTLTTEELLAAGARGAEHLPGPFTARYAVGLTGSGGADAPSLEVRLDLRSTGTDPFRVEAALHSYLAVADVHRAAVVGLDGVPYFDKVTGTRGVQDGPVRFTGETDLVLDSPGNPGVTLETGDGWRVELAPTGSTQTVVWNPWSELYAATADLGAEAWRGFVCVETAATADRALELTPGGTVSIGCRFTVHPPTGA